jgi:type I restriction enzyme, R subunit
MRCTICQLLYSTKGYGREERNMKPEDRARQKIDDLLEQAGWVVQDRDRMNLDAALGVAVREFPLPSGAADYLLFIDFEPVGIVEAKKIGHALIGVEEQSAKYLTNLPVTLSTQRSKLPFSYESNSIETRYTNHLDPEPRSRQVFAFHRPETLQQWLSLAPPDVPNDQNETLRARLRRLPVLPPANLRECQVEAITNLERSLALGKRRALIQMATGSGKTYTSVSAIYRLIKFGGAKRIVFLVDRADLGRQALNEFQQYQTPDDGRRFTDIYNVQHLQHNRIDPVARVCIPTVQRLYSMLSGEPELDPALEEPSMFDVSDAQLSQPQREVSYNPAIPIETFDFIFTDECHRSIYNLWRGVLEYFDASIIGLTATPNGRTYGFFR